MATPGQLISKLSDVLTIPERTVTVYDRVLREAGLLSKAGRGRGSVHRSPLDTARLLIALLSTSAPARAAKAVRDFGALECRKLSIANPDKLDLSKLCGKQFKRVHTLEDAISAIIAGFGRDDFRELLEDNVRGDSRMPLLPYIGIVVYDTKLAAEINIEGNVNGYRHSLLLDANKPRSSDNERDRNLDACFAVHEKYRGIPTQRQIAMPMIMPIAEFIAGIETEPTE